MAEQLIHLLIAQYLHYLIIAISISLGIYLWNREKNLFSFSWARLFSYFFLLWAFDQFLSGYFIGWSNNLEKKLGVFNFLAILMNQEIFNKESFNKFYLKSSFFNSVIWSSVLLLITTSLFLSLGFALWNPKCPLKKFSIKRLVSIFFFVLVGTHFIGQIGRFLFRIISVSLERYNLN